MACNRLGPSRARALDTTQMFVSTILQQHSENRSSARSAPRRLVRVWQSIGGGRRSEHRIALVYGVFEVVAGECRADHRHVHGIEVRRRYLRNATESRDGECMP
eukprot:3193502-Rhodomonas_salina.1